MITIRELSKSYGAEPVLRELDLTVPDGAVTAILGSSGSGKSTLLRCVAGLVRPDAGQIWLGQRMVTALPPEKRRIGLVPQEGSLFPHLSVAGNVAFGLRGRAKMQRARQLLELVGLPGTESLRPHELSGGMQQRVAVARALAPRPAVVLLDEPFSALDAGLRDEVRSVVFEAIRADGATAVLVTHDQEEAFAVADRVAVMMGGAIVQEAPPAIVYLQPATLEVARFVGDTVVLEGVGAGDTVETGFGPLPVQGWAERGCPGTLVLRPEDLRLSDRGFAAGTVSRISYHGHDALIAVDTGKEVLQVRALGQHGVRIGDRVTVSSTRPGSFYPRSVGVGEGRSRLV